MKWSAYVLLFVLVATPLAVFTAGGEAPEDEPIQAEDPVEGREAVVDDDGAGTDEEGAEEKVDGAVSSGDETLEAGDADGEGGEPDGEADEGSSSGVGEEGVEDDGAGGGAGEGGDGKEDGGEGGSGGSAGAAEDARMFGNFEHTESEGSVDGRFVSFSYDVDLGEIAGHSILTGGEMLNVFAAISSDGLIGAVVEGGGAVFSLSGADVEVELHNTPAGIIHIKGSGSTPLAMEAAPGIDMVLNQTSRRVDLSGGGMEGFITYSEYSAELDGDTVEFTPGEGGGSIVFRCTPKESGFSFSYEDGLAEAVAGGKALGELKIAGQGGEYSQYKAVYREGVQMQVKETSHERVKITLSGEGEGGAVALQLNREALPDKNMKNVAVMYDGKEMREVEDPAQVFSATGDEPLYCLEESGSSVAMAVYVPHFSEHTLELTAIDDGDGGGGLPPIAFALVLLSLVVVVMVLAVAGKVNRKK